MLNELSANGTTNSVVVVKNREAFCAKSVTAMNKNSRNLFTYVEFFTAIIAKVEASSFVISLEEIFGSIGFSLLLKFIL